jgi:RNA polymerase sigma factor (sigma-70 family)
MVSNGPCPGQHWRGMDARPRPDARGDAELVRAATAGDRGAFAAIYDRYADRLHDFCWSVLRDREEAADATQDAFLVAAERLGQLRDPERLRPWLYAVARSQAFRRARSRVAPEEEMTDLPDPATGPEQAAQRSDLRQLVWNAAAGLSERDRALLDLHLRHGLEGAELGQAMGVDPGHAYVLLSRLRDQVERSLGALLVARLGRADCPDLSQLLSDWDGRFSPLIRKRVARHVDACQVCSERRRTAASPLALLAAVPPIPAPAYLRGRVLERIQLSGDVGTRDGGSEASGGGSGGPGPGPPAAAPLGVRQPDPRMPGPPVGERSPTGDGAGSAVHRGRRRGSTVALVAALLVAVAVGVGLGWERSPAVSSPTDGRGGPAVAGAATSVAPTTQPTTTATPTPTGSSTSATTGTTATTAPAAPPSLAASPARVDLGPGGTTATLTVRNGGGEPLSWTASPSAPWLRVSPSAGRLDGGQRARLTLSTTRDGLPEGDADARVELTWDGPTRAVAVALRVERPPAIGDLSASPPQIFTGPCTPTTTLVEATVTDESGLSSVTLRWGGRSVPMTPRSGSWFARLGPVPARGTIPWQVVATDDRGNTASASGPAVRVLACP